MLNKLIFVSDKQYQSHLLDIEFWRPIITDLLLRHNLGDKNATITAGFNSTYPVFLTSGVVVKLFGHRSNWQETLTTECAAHKCLATNTAICAPKIIAKGQLFENTQTPWPYTVTTRLPGHSWLDSNPTHEQQLTIITELGRQLRHIHALPVNDELKGNQSWGKLNIKAAAKQSSLPKHLIEQVDEFIAKLDSFDKVFVNGDIVAMHVFVRDGHLSGIIDWGDTTVTDRHYEIGKLYLDIFPGNKTLLRTLLNAANWPLKKNFSTQSLGLALYRQAVGLTQHHTFDVFYKLPNILPINKIKSLDELAHMLFDV